MDDTRLALVLRSIAADLDLPEVAPRLPVRRVDASAARRRWLQGAAAAVVLLLATALTPVRDTVASWLGIGDTEVRTGVDDHDLEALPALEDGVARADRQAVEAALGRGVPDTGSTPLGEPPFAGIPPEGGVLLAWPEGQTTMWIRPASTHTDATYTKLLGGGDGVSRVAGLGDEALLVTGRHELVTPSRSVVADNVVLWVDEGLELRLESDLPPDDLVAMARAVKV